MKQYYDTFSTPMGEFSVALDNYGSVIATAFGGLYELRQRYSHDETIHDPARVAPVRQEIAEYFDGKRKVFTAKLSPSGSMFQSNVWSVLRRIPFGQTRTYGQIAVEIGNEGAARAVGRANATNPICLLIPCHRVIGVDGAITGFAFGEEIKTFLLDHERSLSPTLV